MAQPFRYLLWLVLSIGLFLALDAALIATASAEPKECFTPPGQLKKAERAVPPKPGRPESKAGPRDDRGWRGAACTPTPTVPDPLAALPTATPTPWPEGARDRFNRPDSPVLGRADSNQVWQEVGDWAICDERACAVAPPDDGLYARLQTNLTAQRVQATILPRPTSGVNQAAVLGQITPDWGRYMVYAGITPSGRVELWLLENFVWRQVAAADTRFDGSRARRLELRAALGSATIYVDGTRVLGPIPLPQPPADATFAGIYGETFGTPADYPRLDDFSVTRSR